MLIHLRKLRRYLTKLGVSPANIQLISNKAQEKYKQNELQPYAKPHRILSSSLIWADTEEKAPYWVEKYEQIRKLEQKERSQNA